MKIDAKQLNEVAALMERHGLTRVRLSEQDGRTVELERALPEQVTVAAQAPIAAAAPAAPAPAPAEAPAPSAPTDAATEDAPADDDSTEVTAPMMGIFYVAPQPGAEPFVKVGSKVEKGDTLCVIEAMKLMNEVTAPCSGTVTEVLAEDGNLVEFGACIMKIA